MLCFIHQCPCQIYNVEHIVNQYHVFKSLFFLWCLFVMSIQGSSPNFVKNEFTFTHRNLPSLAFDSRGKHRSFLLNIRLWKALRRFIHWSWTLPQLLLHRCWSCKTHGSRNSYIPWDSEVSSTIRSISHISDILWGLSIPVKHALSFWPIPTEG